MSLAAKALWIIESRRDAPLALAEIAALCGVSPFHLSRAFTARFGQAPIAYQRSRRLTEAARALVFGEAGVAEIAFDAGYASHEAFSRAFRTEFGAPPTAVRGAGDLSALPLTDPLKPETTMSQTLSPPRVESREAFRVAGLAGVFPQGDSSRVPSLWSEFAPHYGEIDGQIGAATYGLYKSGADGETFDYMAGAEVADDAKPDGLAVWFVPAGRFAIFEHHGHISALRGTYQAIFDHGLADAGLAYGEGYEVERYDERFDAASGEGVLEIWIPLA